MLEVTENKRVDNSEPKNEFLSSIKNFEQFLEKTKSLLNSNDNGLSLKDKLDQLLSAGSKRKYHQRTFQDFYILWSILDELSTDSFSNPNIYAQIEFIFNFMKNIPTEMVQESKGYLHFAELIKNLKPEGFEGLFSLDQE